MQTSEGAVQMDHALDRYDPELCKELKTQYHGVRSDIQTRMDEFSMIWSRGDPYEIISELFFCILTPQSRARTCWSTVEELSCRDLLLNGTYDEILEIVQVVRFKYKKTSYILEARDRFFQNGHITLLDIIKNKKDPLEAREWLVREVKGYGYKEASHFLRNIGLGEDLTILDRHILKNLVRADVIDNVPSSMSGKRYLEIEEKMKAFSSLIKIPLAHLDLLLWYRETGEIFK